MCCLSRALHCSEVGGGAEAEELELLYSKANEWYLRSIELSSESSVWAMCVVWGQQRI